MAYRLQNTFQAQTPVGSGLQSLAQAMFGNRATPADQADAELTRLKSANERMNYKKTQQELDDMQARADARDPSNIPRLAAYQTGVPQPEIDQYMQFAEQGVPYDRPEWTPEVAGAVRNALSGHASLPYMTGDTNYQQFMAGQETGADMQRDRQLYEGQIAPAMFSKMRAAEAGDPMYAIQGNTLLDPFSGDMQTTPLGQSMIGENQAQAGLYGQQADRQGTLMDYDRARAESERREDATGGDSKPLDVSATDLKYMDTTIAAMAQEQGGIEPQAGAMILERASNYFSDPNSPYFGNHDGAAMQAFQELAVVGEDPTTPLNPLTWFSGQPPISAERAPLPFQRGGQPPNVPPISPGTSIAPGGAPQPVQSDDLPDPATLPDGAEAYNPETGERMITRGGRWVPVGG